MLGVNPAAQGESLGTRWQSYNQLHFFQLNLGFDGEKKKMLGCNILLTSFFFQLSSFFFEEPSLPLLVQPVGCTKSRNLRLSLQGSASRVAPCCSRWFPRPQRDPGCPHWCQLLPQTSWSATSPPHACPSRRKALPDLPHCIPRRLSLAFLNRCILVSDWEL